MRSYVPIDESMNASRPYDPTSLLVLEVSLCRQHAFWEHTSLGGTDTHNFHASSPRTPSLSFAFEKSNVLVIAACPTIS